MDKNSETFYAVLNLKQDCSTGDIKKSFISLSKKYHPDMCKNVNDQKLFIKVNEAYSVLSKPASRRMYDQHLVNIKDRTYVHYYDNIYTTRNDWQSKGMEFTNHPYYSIKGVKKVSNTVIVVICGTIAAIGLGVEYFALKKSLAIDQEQLRHDNAKNYMAWQYAKKIAEENGNEQQIQKFKDNLLRGKTNAQFNEMYSRQLLEEEQGKIGVDTKS